MYSDMEDYESQDPRLRREKPEAPQRGETFDWRESPTEEKQTLSTQAVVKAYLEERNQKAARNKWTGRIMMLFGIATILGSCPFYALSVIPGQSVAAGLAIMIAGLAITAGGGVVLSLRPRLKDTNEALLVAARHGNRLSVSLLALEMDISFQKAEKIIRELVRSGIAEIDLEYRDPDHSIVYKIRGL